MPIAEEPNQAKQHHHVENPEMNMAKLAIKYTLIQYTHIIIQYTHIIIQYTHIIIQYTYIQIFYSYYRGILRTSNYFGRFEFFQF